MTGSFLCIGHVPEDTSRPDDMGGQPTTHHFTTTEVFQKQGDVWKLIQFTFTALVH